MKIAIIGGGFAGLAVAAYLPQNDITLFDPGGESASGIAAGLLHKFAGMHAKKNPFADAALADSLELLNQTGAFTPSPILRPALTDEQLAFYHKSFIANPELKFLENCADYEPLAPQKPGLLIQGYIVNCPLYLEKLKKLLANKVNFIKKKITTLCELSNYDRVILTMGAEIKSLADIEVTQVKGRLAELPPLPLLTPLSSHIYAIPGQDKLVVGATYERGEAKGSLEDLLMPRLKDLIPSLSKFEPLLIREGARATTKDRLPIIKQIDKKTIAYAGLGSKGLLYHAYYAKKLVQEHFL
jgi:glycine/D-amino acid oxidase-like deaminating enzyme